MRNAIITVGLFIGMLPFTHVKSQITITNSSMPAAGSTYVFDNVAPPQGLNLNQTGPNTTWDFSNLGQTGSDTVDFVSVSSTPIAYQFFFNNVFLYPNNKADYATPSGDLAMGGMSPVSITDVVNYYKKPNSGLYMVGFGANVSGIPTSVQYDPIDRIFEFPLNFGNSDTSDYAYFISVPTVGAYGESKTRSNEVDGWGTLLLPNGASYPTLRIKSVVQGTDTFYLDSFGFGFAFPSTRIEYKWMTNTVAVPLLQIDAQSGLGGNISPSSVRYLHHEDQTGLIPYAQSGVSKMTFANPVAKELIINYNSSQLGQTTLRVTDLNGKEVIKSGFTATGVLQRISLPIDALSDGLYLVSIEQGSYRECKKLLIAQ